MGKVNKAKERGCHFCPLNEVRGLQKVKNLDKITGRSIMLWAQNPGQEENRQGKELVGPAGRFLWAHAAKAGLRREDCDIQNVVRCWTVTKNELNQLVPRNPAKEELHCCSVYSEQAIALNKGMAKVHIVLGQVAAKALLRGEYRKGQNTFYSERLRAWVVMTYHPSYFLRGAPRSRLKDFVGALRTAVEKAKQKRGKYQYVYRQDYQTVKASGLEALRAELLEAAKTGRIAVDIEDGYDAHGNNVVVYVGFSYRRGMARGLLLCHAKLRQNEKARAAKLSFLREILENSQIRKVFHHGVYDIWKLKKLLGISVRGVDHDTEYSEYQRFSWAKAYGLAAIADRRFRQFAGYKGILDPYKDAVTGRVNFFTIPLKILRIYNGADSDLTKRIEVSNDGRVNQALLAAMIQVAKPLARMEENGPIFDWEHDKVLVDWIPKKLDTIIAQLREMSGLRKLNPNKPKDIARVIYSRLKLGKYLSAEWKKDYPRSTNKDTLQLLGPYHRFPGLVIQYRKLAKKKSTYMDGYRLSAQMFGGRLRTKWWLTGTVTCRLRSGGSKGKDKKSGLVNLQNIHGDPTIENLLVSDLSWREIYDDWKTEGKML